LSYTLAVARHYWLAVEQGSVDAQWYYDLWLKLGSGEDQKVVAAVASFRALIEQGNADHEWCSGQWLRIIVTKEIHMVTFFMVSRGSDGGCACFWFSGDQGVPMDSTIISHRS
jgi:hypothetical protein